MKTRSIFIVIVLLAMLIGSVKYLNKQTYTGTITDKYNKRNGDTDYFYIVLDDKRVIKNRDDLLIGKFDSADIQARSKVGTKVKVETAGFRIHFLNMYPNLIDIKKVDK